MRYNAFYGELPIDAFKPRGFKFGSMTLHGGGDPISAVTSAVSDAVSGVGDVVQSGVNAVSDLGTSIDQTVRNVLPGGWTTAALLAAGAYYSPEIGAYITPAGETVPVGGEVVAPAVSNPVYDIGSTATASNPIYDIGSTAADTGAGLTAGGGTGLTGTSTGVGMTAPSTVGGLANAGAAYGTGSMLGDVATGAATGAAGGSTLASMLPYMTAAQLGSGLLQANSAKNAANIQSAAAQGATQLQGQMFNTINTQQAPYRTAGYQALNQINALGSGPFVQYDASGNPIGTSTGSGYLTHQFGPADLEAGLAPNYNFMLQQGQMANQRAANLGGGGFGGNALQGLNKFTQDYAGNAYQNAFTNYQNQRTNIYNTLAGIAGIGQTGQTATNTAGTNATNAIGQLGVGSAAAQAAGQIGSTSALANTANNIIGNYTLASLLNQNSAT